MEDPIDRTFNTLRRTPLNQLDELYHREMPEYFWKKSAKEQSDYHNEFLKRHNWTNEELDRELKKREEGKEDV